MQNEPATALATLVFRAMKGPRNLWLCEDDARAARVSLNLALSVVGKLMTCEAAIKELDHSELSSLGDLFWTLNETCHQLSCMEGTQMMEGAISRMMRDGLLDRQDASTLN